MGIPPTIQRTAEALAEIRRQCDPDPGDPDAVRAFCPRCGRPYWARKRDSRRLCSPCAVAAQIAAGAGNSRKAGPEYERTVRGQLRYWRSEADRLGI